MMQEVIWILLAALAWFSWRTHTLEHRVEGLERELAEARAQIPLKGEDLDSFMHRTASFEDLRDGISERFTLGRGWHFVDGKDEDEGAA